MIFHQHSGKVIEANQLIKHVMAISLDPTTQYRYGLARVIIDRSGNVDQAGYLDKSELHIIERVDQHVYALKDRLTIKNSDPILNELFPKYVGFLGFEDPDIFVDPESGLMHAYFTIPIKNKTDDGYLIHLGHCIGTDLMNLEMTRPAIIAEDGYSGAKEVCVMPKNRNGLRLNLVESGLKGKNYAYSTIRIATCYNINEAWELGDHIFNPENCRIPWIAGHASPGPLLPENFINLGEGKRIGFINGREANIRKGKNIHYGKFQIGLFIYNYEEGKIEWVSPEPIIFDSEATTITFASQYVPIDDKTGILYAHVDDSFVRAYTIEADKVKKILINHSF